MIVSNEVLNPRLIVSPFSGFAEVRFQLRTAVKPEPPELGLQSSTTAACIRPRDVVQRRFPASPQGAAVSNGTSANCHVFYFKRSKLAPAL
jgi:hypothetical protein